VSLIWSKERQKVSDRAHHSVDDVASVAVMLAMNEYMTG